MIYQQSVTDTNIWRIAGPGSRGQTSNKKESSATRLIASTQTEVDPQFSPDGLKIAFASDRSGSGEIWVCASDGSNPVQVTASGGPAGSPRWSPDGQQIAFDSANEGKLYIYVVRSDGGLPRRLTTESYAADRPSWSRDGRWIYFGSNRSGERQVWKAPSQGGTAVQVTQKGGWDAFESPDGKWLYYTKDPPIQGLWRIPVAGGEEIQVLDHGRPGFWSVADAGIFLLNPKTKSGPNIEFFSFATSRLTQISKLRTDLIFDLGDTSISVSPDARWIIYVSIDQIGSDLVLAENFR
jgi:Tol biopolymer transport system component